MSIRESLNRIPPTISIAVVAVIIVAVGIFAYSQMGSGSSQAEAIAEAGEKTTLKCTACGHTFERDTAELQRMSPDPFGRIEMTSEMSKCPKCSQLRLQIVEDAGP